MKQRKELVYRFKIPEQITILNDKWSVEIVDRIINNSKECVGITNPQEKKIQIKKNLNGSSFNALEVFSHEISHAISFTLNKSQVEYSSELWGIVLGKIMKDIIEQVLKESFKQEEPKITEEDLLKDLEEIKNNADKQIRKLKGGKI